MRIKHPDTFTCDVCGADMSSEQRVAIPVLHDRSVDEYGARPLEEPDIDCKELDLCDECLSRVTVIRERPVFYGASEYEFIDREQK